MFDVSDTIVAIASPLGTAVRGVVRVSGNNAVNLLHQVMHEPIDIHPSRTARYLGQVSVERIGLVPTEFLVWPLGKSYTGQPVVECHTWGATPLLEGLVQEFVRSGARPARPGEYTLRAFLAGRIDLVQAEAVLAVIDADSGQQLQNALNQLAGGMTGPLQEARERILDLVAEIEAGLDFADEDLHFISDERLVSELRQVRKVIAAAQQQMAQRRLVNERPRVVLVGLPNAGKSSLLNRVAGYSAAIVSSQPGTTRDWLVVTSEIDGTAIDWIDTAGVEAIPEIPIPQIPDGQHEAHLPHAVDLSAEPDVAFLAQAATAEQARQADLRLLCLDLTCEQLSPWESEQLTLAAGQANVLVVGTKRDLVAERIPPWFPPSGLTTSSETGRGMSELRDAIVQAFELAATNEQGTAQFVASTAQRCASSLACAADAIDEALNLVGRGTEELLAAELRIALAAMGEVTGQIYTDDILDRIFSRFCIGK